MKLQKKKAIKGSKYLKINKQGKEERRNSSTSHILFILADNTRGDSVHLTTSQLSI